MLEHTKTPLIDPVTLSFTVPRHLVETVLKTMHSYGVREKNETISWREAMPTEQEEWPQIALRGGRVKEGLTQKQLSEMTGIPRCHISAMENGKRPIGKQTAKKLAEALNIDPRCFLAV